MINVGTDCMSERLRRFGPEIWMAGGPVVSFCLPLSNADGCNAAVYDSLFVWSPVALSDSLRSSVNALALVRYVVPPNALHRPFLEEWKTAYPAARLYASPRLRRKRKTLTFDAELGDPVEPQWATNIDQVIVHGSFALTEVVFSHDPVRRSDPKFSARLVQRVARLPYSA